jgi:hypothetical protein
MLPDTVNKYSPKGGLKYFGKRFFKRLAPNRIKDSITVHGVQLLSYPELTGNLGMSYLKDFALG